MIAWLNENQGAVMALLTIVYVVATIALAWVGVRSARVAQEQVRLTYELERNRTRPYVDFDIVVENGDVHAVLSNRGQTPATNVKLTLTPKLERPFSAAFKECAFTKHRVGMLTPGRRLRDLLNTSPSFFKQYPEPRFTGELEYGGSDGSAYREPVAVDLSVHLSTAFTRQRDVGEEIEKLTRVVTDAIRNR